MNDTSHTSDPVCPHCGHVERDAWEMDFGPGLEGDTTVTCGACDEEYRCERNATIYYTSTKCEASHDR